MKLSTLPTIFLLSAFGQYLHADFNKVINKHCIKCHGKDGKVKGKVNLLELQKSGDWQKHPELLEDLIVVLEDEEMPPEKEPEMAPEVRKRLIAQGVA